MPRILENRHCEGPLTASTIQFNTNICDWVWYSHASNYMIMWAMQNCRSFRIYLP